MVGNVIVYLNYMVTILYVGSHVHMKNTCENMALITEIACCLQNYKYVGEFLKLTFIILHATPMKYKPPVLNCFEHFTEQNNDINRL